LYSLSPRDQAAARKLAGALAIATRGLFLVLREPGVNVGRIQAPPTPGTTRGLMALDAAQDARGGRNDPGSCGSGQEKVAVEAHPIRKFQVGITGHVHPSAALPP